MGGRTFFTKASAGLRVLADPQSRLKNRPELGTLADTPRILVTAAVIGENVSRVLAVHDLNFERGYDALQRRRELKAWARHQAFRRCIALMNRGQRLIYEEVEDLEVPAPTESAKT